MRWGYFILAIFCMIIGVATIIYNIKQPKEGYTKEHKFNPFLGDMAPPDFSIGYIILTAIGTIIDFLVYSFYTSLPWWGKKALIIAIGFGIVGIGIYCFLHIR